MGKSDDEYPPWTTPTQYSLGLCAAHQAKNYPNGGNGIRQNMGSGHRCQSSGGGQVIWNRIILLNRDMHGLNKDLPPVVRAHVPPKRSVCNNTCLARFDRQ